MVFILKMIQIEDDAEGRTTKFINRFQILKQVFHMLVLL
jgi:hypothetical protein